MFIARDVPASKVKPQLQLGHVATLIEQRIDGVPTTAIRMSGPIRAAIVSCATCSPDRTAVATKN